MPNAVTFGAGQRTLSYGYDANGEKHSVTHISSSGTSVTEYCDNVIYRNGSPAILLTEIGYYSFADGRYHTYIRDWQGNNRVVLRDDGLVEELNDYYASGCRIGGADEGVQPYKYSGKELDTFGDLNWYDFGARHYDPVLMRWTTTDPLSEKYYGVSPYAFCDNDPVNRFDPNGKWDIKVSAMNDRGNYPYAMLTVMKRGGETIYKTVVKIRGNHRNRSQTNGDTPIGEYKIDEWRQTGTHRYPADAYGPNELLALIYLGKEGTGRSGIHLHGGRNQMELSNTLGCIRIADEDIAELKVLTEALEASNPEESKGRLIVENDLIEDIKYQDRESVKYDWERCMGKLNAAVVIADN